MNTTTANIIPIAQAATAGPVATSKSPFWDVERKLDSIGWNALMELRSAAGWAARTGDFETVERLLPVCAPAQCHVHLPHALAAACRNGHQRIVRLLYRHGVRLSCWPEERALAPRVEAIVRENLEEAA
jgi:hypothetical protein